VQQSVSPQKKDKRRRVVIPYTYRKRKIPLSFSLSVLRASRGDSMLAPHSTTDFPEKRGTIESSKKDAREKAYNFEPK
jgi:hypothetical protein